MGVGFLEGDQAAGELKQGEMVLRLLRLADQERAVAVEPGVARLDHPASWPPALENWTSDSLWPASKSTLRLHFSVQHSP
jgi:hypothetical protein